LEKLATKLKVERTNKNLTQFEIADILKINRVTYQGYEKGKHDPNLDTLIKLADFYKTSTDYLLGRYD